MHENVVSLYKDEEPVGESSMINGSVVVNAD